MAKKGVDTPEDIKNKAAKLKQSMDVARKADLRDKIVGTGLVNQIIEIKDKVYGQEVDSDTLSRYKFVVETNFKLLAKVLPDLKAVEMTGADGGDLTIQIVRFCDSNTIT